MFKIRNYKSEDIMEIVNLFYNTVHIVNAKDYSKEQLDVWAPKEIDFEKFNKSLSDNYTLVVTYKEEIVGFGDIDETGYLDHLYVHIDYNKKKIATLICNELESSVDGDITTHASITAKPFFENRGYNVITKQIVERQNITLINYVMIKTKKHH